MNKLLFILTIAFFAACNPQRTITTETTSTTTESTNDVDVAVRVEETELADPLDRQIIVRQKNYMQALLGEWNFNIMRPQAMANPVQLGHVHITFMADSTFSGHAPCNNISGKYTIKGTGISFSNIISTKRACNLLSQETELLRLLQNTVSAYTVEGNRLLLRDGASNIIFEASKK